MSTKLEIARDRPLLFLGHLGPAPGPETPATGSFDLSTAIFGGQSPNGVFPYGKYEGGKIVSRTGFTYPNFWFPEGIFDRTRTWTFTFHYGAAENGELKAMWISPLNDADPMADFDNNEYPYARLYDTDEHTNFSGQNHSVTIYPEDWQSVSPDRNTLLFETHRFTQLEGISWAEGDPEGWTAVDISTAQFYHSGSDVYGIYDESYAEIQSNEDLSPSFNFPGFTLDDDKTYEIEFNFEHHPTGYTWIYRLTGDTNDDWLFGDSFVLIYESSSEDSEVMEVGPGLANWDAAVAEGGYNSYGFDIGLYSRLSRVRYREKP